MKHKTQSYMNAVKKIKSLPKRSTERTAAIKAAAEKFGVPIRTIYHDAKKPFAKIGVRKKRKDAGVPKVKITAKEKQMFSELIESGFSKSEAKEITEQTMKKKISNRTKTKIAKKIESEKTTKPKDAEVSAFGSEFKIFLEKLFNFEKISYNKKINVKFKNKTVPISKRALNYILMIVAGEHNLHEFKEEKKLKYDGDLLMMAMLKYQLIEQMNYAFENNDLDAQNTISLMLTRLKDNIKDYSPNFLGMYKVIREEFKKTITKAELLSLLIKHCGEGVNDEQ